MLAVYDHLFRAPNLTPGELFGLLFAVGVWVGFLGGWLVAQWQDR